MNSGRFSGLKTRVGIFSVIGADEKAYWVFLRVDALAGRIYFSKIMTTNCMFPLFGHTVSEFLSSKERYWRSALQRLSVHRALSRCFCFKNVLNIYESRVAQPIYS